MSLITSSTSTRPIQLEEAVIQSGTAAVLTQRITALEQENLDLRVGQESNIMRQARMSFQAARTAHNAQRELEACQALLTARNREIENLTHSVEAANAIIDANQAQIDTLTDERAVDANLIHDLRDEIRVLRERIALLNENLINRTTELADQRELTELHRQLIQLNKNYLKLTQSIQKKKKSACILGVITGVVGIILSPILGCPGAASGYVATKLILKIDQAQEACNAVRRRMQALEARLRLNVPATRAAPVPAPVVDAVQNPLVSPLTPPVFAPAVPVAAKDTPARQKKRVKKK